MRSTTNREVPRTTKPQSKKTRQHTEAGKRDPHGLTRMLSPHSWHRGPIGERPQERSLRRVSFPPAARPPSPVGTCATFAQRLRGKRSPLNGDPPRKGLKISFNEESSRV